MAIVSTTFVAGQVLTAAHLNTYFMAQVLAVADSSSDYPSSPSEGRFLYDKATDSIVGYDGSAFVQALGLGSAADSSYVPTLTQSSSVGFSGESAHYVRNGHVVEAWVRIPVTGTGTSGSAVIVGLPVNGATHTNGQTIGEGTLYDASAGDFIPVICYLRSSSTVGFRYADTSGAELGGGAAPLALGSGDILTFHVRYLVA